MLALPRAEQLLSVVRYLFTVCSVFVHRKRHLPLSLAMPTSQTRSSGRQSREVSSFLSWLWVSECCAAEMAFGGLQGGGGGVRFGHLSMDCVRVGSC